MRGWFIDTADLTIIARAAKHLRIKRIDMVKAKERLEQWREETLECQSFETWLEGLDKKPAAEGGAEK